ncbi:MAG: FGGY-family carbohydrate kinase [Microthrixaceae bacterium]|nr:FGGY-family carbohydrate kinase [Microthrixaceae bacterium]
MPATSRRHWLARGCVRPGDAKATFGTGAMLDVCIGPQRPGFTHRGEAGCFPMIAWRDGSGVTWGTEAVMLSAGTNLEWLVEDLGIIDSPEESESIALSVADTDGVVYVPALLGLGTPHWDYGARGTLLGVTRGTTAAHVVRAVLGGIAHRGADLLEAARSDSGLTLDRLRVDGGMAANSLFVQMVADTTGVPVEVSPRKEATTLGAGYLAGLAIGTWSGWDDIAAAWAPSAVIEPDTGAQSDTSRQRWAEAIDRSKGWHEDLSALDF